jgi:hypothetical protein
MKLIVFFRVLWCFEVIKTWIVSRVITFFDAVVVHVSLQLRLETIC